MGSVEIKFLAKDIPQAARLQQQILTQMGLIGYTYKEFKVIPTDKNKVETTLILEREKKKKP
ncbi:MAG: hypothetical protein ACI4U9_02135 [Clostridia bacterium]